MLSEDSASIPDSPVRARKSVHKRQQDTVRVALQEKLQQLFEQADKLVIITGLEHTPTVKLAQEHRAQSSE